MSTSLWIQNIAENMALHYNKQNINRAPPPEISTNLNISGRACKYINWILYHTDDCTTPHANLLLKLLLIVSLKTLQQCQVASMCVTY